MVIKHPDTQSDHAEAHAYLAAKNTRRRRTGTGRSLNA
jgi:hypothetical protein